MNVLEDAFDVAIIGAGVVGAAIAVKSTALGLSTIVLERGAKPGFGISSRNSGVIHSGLYYAPKSLKAETCVRGQRLLYEWCRAHRVGHQMTGKLVVADNAAEAQQLEALYRLAKTNGATVELIDGNEVRVREPELPAKHAALWCPETGIVDAHELTQSYVDVATAQGAFFAFSAALIGSEALAGGQRLHTARGPIDAQVTINAAGLAAVEVARCFGEVPFTLYPCRGDYFRLQTKRRFNHLVYPCKVPGNPGLGVHLTLDLAGRLRLGPDAFYVSSADDFAPPRENKAEAFEAAAHKLLELRAGDLIHYDDCGIRPKLRGPHEPEEKDFVVFSNAPGVFHLLGIESPGLTASLALAELVLGRIS